ncbi:BrnA antitoxin family protein [Rhodanobacter sp. DHB23]|uniref:BrnA antitoxin family protein n=1 Tax=Rhodanobacter sp. DHB23 TaxID=2775923 RepID=UPI00177CD21B|nr:BrnA antitoxin family protein [Rhodanobacter sp. DHB23]MBD8872559.1 BrnA antitoxin family protein [Rhodanobacter sp. DHB23]
MNKRPAPEMIDNESPEWTDADFARAKPFAKLPATLQAKLRGRPKVESPRVAISLRLPPDVLEAWKATGAGWQTRMAAMLSSHAPHAKAR